jgi:hypothetical protein
MKLADIQWKWAIGAALAAECLLVIAAVAWVAIYSHLLHPNQSLSVYQQYAQQASPWVSLVCGVPVFYGLCRFLGTRMTPPRAMVTALAVFAVYCLIEVPFFLLSDSPYLPPWFAALNFSAKCFACFYGGRHASSAPVARLS